MHLNGILKKCSNNPNMQERGNGGRANRETDDKILNINSITTTIM